MLSIFQFTNGENIKINLDAHNVNPFFVFPHICTISRCFYVNINHNNLDNEGYDMKKIRIIVTSVLFLVILIGVVAYFLTTYGSESDQSYKNNITSTKTTLSIPKILEDENPKDDQAEYHLTAQNSSKTFVKGIERETYGYHGDYLGPVIRAKKGEEVTVHIQNDL